MVSIDSFMVVEDDSITLSSVRFVALDPSRVYAAKSVQEIQFLESSNLFLTSNNQLHFYQFFKQLYSLLNLFLIFS